MGREYEFGDIIFDDVMVLERCGGNDSSGFGVVYLVMDKNTGFCLAMKTLQRDKFSIDDFEKFKKEVIPWIKFSNHPNIVKAYTIDLDDNKKPYLLMEPVFADEFNRKSLTDFMDDDLREEQILKWSIQVCYAMDYVNHQGYYHGDIKPDNILISNGCIKITDFGLVGLIEDNDEANYGSPCYIAPESWEGIKNVSSDIYSFGMVMYQMINSGVLPFDGITNFEWENFHKTGEIPKLNSDLFPLVSKCLEKEPQKRYSSFNDLNHDLINILYEKFNQKIEKPVLEDIGNIENMNKGHLAAIFGDVVNCKKYYDIAILNSKDKSFIYNYALDLISLEEYSDALIQLNILLENPDKIPLDRIYFNIGKCYHEGICLYKSIKYYKNAIKINNNDFKAHTNLGNVYMQYGLFEDALTHYNYVLDKNNEFQEALVNISELYRRMGDKTNFDFYTSKLKDITSTPLTNYYLGVYLKNIDVLSFLISMGDATEEYTYQIPALIQLFEFHLSKGSISEADNKFKEIFQLSGENIDLGISLCFLYGRYEYYEEGIIKLDYIYEKSSEDRILFEKSVFLGQYDLQRAIIFSKNLIKEINDDLLKSKVYVNLGYFYSKINVEKTFDFNLKAYNINPKNISSLKNLATYYANNGDYFFAEMYVDEGLEIDYWNNELLLIKSKLCSSQFKFDEAIDFYNKCLKLNPTSEVYMHISACFGMLQNFEIALIYLDLAFNISEEDNLNFEWASLYIPILYALEYIEEDYLNEI